MRSDDKHTRTHDWRYPDEGPLVPLGDNLMGKVKITDATRWAYHQPLSKNWPAILGSILFYASILLGIAALLSWWGVI